MTPTKPGLPDGWKLDAPADILDYIDQEPLDFETVILANTLVRRDPAKLIADTRFDRATFEQWLERYREAAAGEGS